MIFGEPLLKTITSRRPVSLDSITLQATHGPGRPVASLVGARRAAARLLELRRRLGGGTRPRT